MAKKSIIKYAFILIIFILSANAFAQPRKSWQYYLEKGKVEYKAEMYDFALENLEKALEVNSESYEAANIMGEIYLLNDKKEEAIEYFDISLGINEKQPDIHCKIGRLYEFFLQFKTAFKHYKRAVTADPNHIEGHLNLIRMYTRNNDRENALKHFKICNKLGKEEGDKFFNEALSAEKEDEDSAIDLYKRAIEKNPALIDAYYRLSDIYRRKEEPDKAIPYLIRITEIRPDLDRAWVHLGHLYFNKALSGQPLKSRHLWNRENILKKAKESFEEAIRINPDNRSLYSYIADIYEYLGEEDRAMEARNKAIKFDRGRLK